MTLQTDGRPGGRVGEGGGGGVITILRKAWG